MNDLDAAEKRAREALELDSIFWRSHALGGYVLALVARVRELEAIVGRVDKAFTEAMRFRNSASEELIERPLRERAEAAEEDAWTARNAHLDTKARLEAAEAERDRYRDALRDACMVLHRLSWEGSSVNFPCRTVLNAIRERGFGEIVERAIQQSEEK